MTAPQRPGSGDAAPPRVAFVHIPRTAGTAFGQMLDAVYEGHPVATFYGDEASAVVNGRLDAFRMLPRHEKDRHRLLRGHFVHGFAEDLEDVRHITLLRSPLERLVSYYFYALQDRRHYLHAYLMQRRTGLEAFLLSDASIDLDNYQVRAVSGHRFASSRDRVTAAHLEEAKDRLVHGFAAFGLTERFAESMRSFERTFGWRLPPAIRVNEGRRPAAIELPASCRDRVLEKNRFDVELHAFACALFEQRLAA